MSAGSGGLGLRWVSDLGASELGALGVATTAGVAAQPVREVAPSKARQANVEQKGEETTDETRIACR